MSTATTAASARTAPAPRRAPLEGPRRLRALDTRVRRRRPRLGYAIAAIAGVLVIGAAQMSLSIMTTQSSYTVAKLTQEQRELTLQKQVLYDDVAGLSSPQNLAANASALGMIITQSPSFLRLSDGKVLGKGGPATGSSSVNVLKGSVPNALISDVPLVTDPEATVGSPEKPDAAVVAGPDGATTDAPTPPPLTDGLPSPSTH